MNTSTMKTHPLMVIAAITVILTCLLAIGVMTGLVPSPLARDRDVVGDATPAAKRAQTADNRARTKEPDNVGSTRSESRPGILSGRGPATCDNCGTVTSVRLVKEQGEASVVGPLAGGAIGGLVGSQIGGGSGKQIATIAGAAGGAAIGTEVERRAKATTHYVVGVRLNDGSAKSFTYGAAPGVQEGDKVKVVDGKLIRDS